jgi:hypothetical protein
MPGYIKQRSVSARELANAFVRGNGHAVRSGSALSATRETIYSYAEPIAAFDPTRPGTLLLTSAKFSVTTSKHTGMIRAAAALNGVPFETVDHATVERASRGEVAA